MVSLQSFRRLKREHDELKEDFGALVRCLDKYGAACGHLLHREKFETALRRSPLADGGPSPSVADVLGQPRLLAAALNLCGGRREEISALSATSLRCNTCVDAVQAKKICVLGGNDALFGRTVVLSGRKELKSAECYDARQGTWSALPPLCIGRVGSVAAAIAGRIVICGGVGKLGKLVDEFDLQERKWDRSRPRRKLDVPRFQAAGVTLRGRLYIIGGESTVDGQVHRTAVCLDPSLARSQADCQSLPFGMSVPRRLLAAAPLPGQGVPSLMACGGCGTSVVWDGTPNRGAPYSTTEALSLSSLGRAWRPQAPLTCPRFGHAAVALQGSVWVCGGQPGDGTVLSTVERLDLDTGVWVASSPMSVERHAATAVAVGGRLYVLGGVRSGLLKAQALSSGERFNPRTGSWEPVTDMLQCRVHFSIVAAKVGDLAA